VINNFEAVLLGYALPLGTRAIIAMVAFVITELCKNPINRLEMFKWMIHKGIFLPKVT